MPGPRKTVDDVMLRVPRTVMDLADRLVPAMAADPAEIARGPVSRSSIARVAMVIGIQELARRYDVDLTAVEVEHAVEVEVLFEE